MAKAQKHNADSPSLTPEEMKAIGEIELGPSRHEQFLNAHYKKLIIGILVFMLVATAGIVYGTWRVRQESDAAAEVLAAMGTPTGVVQAEGYDLAKLEHVVAAYPGTKAAATAELMRGMKLLAGGQEQQGISALESFIASATDDELRLRAQVTLAGYYMDGGDVQKATTLWQTVARAGVSPWQPIALLTLGDLAGQGGDAEAARLYYTQLQESCPQSSLANAAQQRILTLGVDAPVPVAPEAQQKEAPQQDGAAELPGWTPVNFSAQ